MYIIMSPNKLELFHFISFTFARAINILLENYMHMIRNK